MFQLLFRRFLEGNYQPAPPREGASLSKTPDSNSKRQEKLLGRQKEGLMSLQGLQPGDSSPLEASGLWREARQPLHLPPQPFPEALRQEGSN